MQKNAVLHNENTTFKSINTQVVPADIDKFTQLFSILITIDRRVRKEASDAKPA
mgnify:FL=1